MMNDTVLVVDENAETLEMITSILQKQDYTVFTAQTAGEALRIFEVQNGIGVVLADLKLPDGNGLELYRKISTLEADIPYIIMTAHGTIESAVEAMKEGVSNYLIKPINYSELSIVLEKAVREKRISNELAELRQEKRERSYRQEIIGSDVTIKKIFDIIKTAAPTNVPILITGETGTGKELIAKAIHALSNRHDKPMKCINSAALAENLLEAELFGYVKGAFTGATFNKKGRLESAHLGTLFLDEIAHMSLGLQTKLLRFLQEGTFEMVGGLETRKVDVRLITATNRDLRKEIAANRFLSDLLYRIEVISIHIPPLRERKEDIILLVNHFNHRFGLEYGKPNQGVLPEAMDVLVRYPWPGNVRELENCIARAIILSKGTHITLGDMPSRISNTKNSKSIPFHRNEMPDSLEEEILSIKQMECKLIKQTLSKCHGNKTLAANYLGINRKTLYEKIERYTIET